MAKVIVRAARKAQDASFSDLMQNGLGTAGTAHGVAQHGPVGGSLKGVAVLAERLAQRRYIRLPAIPIQSAPTLTISHVMRDHDGLLRADKLLQFKQVCSPEKFRFFPGK